mmetsp:Transcript_20336/g.68942  ORF Transcript_20336/g.68942 Transcript_20336/m.68942 type:complete len:510 (-) Transcript_20336:1435-2964(-)
MASVFLAELDADVIGLGEDCTNPLFTAPPPPKPSHVDPRRVALEVDDDVSAWEPSLGIVKMDASKKAIVSVSDCLACSGCVTSAETVLLSLQSGPALLELAKSRTIALSLSHASLASLADAAETDTCRALAAFEKLWRANIQATFVVHTANVHDAVLAEVAQEFAERLRHADAETQQAKPDAPAPSIALSSTRQRDVAGADAEVGPAQRRGDGRLPLVTSACPGVVCFIEKSCPKVLPHVSSARSPMSALGALIKQRDGAVLPAGAWDKPVAHVAVMPCADKKLEAARRDFLDDGMADVELVLTTVEALELVGGISALRAAVDAGCSDEDLSVAAAASHGAAKRKGGSGGFLEYAYRAALRASLAPDACLKDVQLEYKRNRNDDLHEVTLKRPGLRDLRFAAAYGFRNVQRVTSQIARGASPYDFVELMACPAGCVNGGGQLRDGGETRQAGAERVSRVDAAFHGTRQIVDPETTPVSVRRRDLEAQLHTRYHAVPLLADTLSPAQAKW